MSFYSGYAQEKPTSKVLNPPGGKSNNIFGTDEPVAPVVKNGSNGHHTNGSSNGNTQTNGGSNGVNHQNANGNGHGNGNFHHHSTSITAPGMNQQQNQLQQSKGSHQADRSKSSIFEDPNGAGKDQERNKRVGYNPITGQSYSSMEADAEKSYQVHKEEQRQHAQEVVDNKVISDAAAVVKQQAATAAATTAAQNGTTDENGKSLNVHTSSRVLQPPGGRSTNLW